jgi:alkanesulfonate monooxygenase SsuD/methylene tetrahydromethanopterin reductase-like flavin-dependent oxidoreductase (luciferase family)
MDGEVARRAARVLAAFYIPSMPPALLERHAIAPEEVAPVNDAFVAGDIKRALASTPDSLADRLVVAGTPDDWLHWLTETYAAAGLDHALVSFADPFTLRTWAGVSIDGLPSLGEQVRLFGEHVLQA